jgi:hypothetical protein
MLKKISHHWDDLPCFRALADRCFNSNLPWLAELMPNMMVELSENWPMKRGLKTVTT